MASINTIRDTSTVNRPEQTTGGRVEEESIIPYQASDQGAGTHNTSDASPKPYDSPILVKPIQFPKLEIRNNLSNETFKILNQWQGYVLERHGEKFSAVIKDLTDPSYPDEEIDFSIEDLSESSDEPLVRSGAVFYYYIGYYTTHEGVRYKSEFIKFRRLPQWNKSKVEQIEKDASQIALLLGSGQT